MIKIIKIFIINLIILIAVSEFSLSVFYAIKNQHVIKPSVLFSQHFIFDSIGDKDCAWGAMVGLHPYLSIYYPLKDVCTTSSRNNYGFRSLDIPIEYDSNFFTVLITGASVAEQVGRGNGNTSQNYLENYLNSKWKSPKQKPFRVISAAIAGAHQPITLFQSVLFSKVADQVISIEGFNEHFATSGDQLIEQPAPAWMDLVMASEDPIEFYVLSKLTQKAKTIKDSILLNSYTTYAFLSESIDWLRKDIKSKQENLHPFPNPSNDWSAKKKENFYLQQYLYYIELTNSVLSSQKKNYTLFIQPAPYAYKNLTEQEVASAGDITGQKRYTSIKNGIKTLMKKNIHIESLEKIFENEKKTLYIDYIHTNQEGVEIMSEQIADRLAVRYRWKKNH
jgi:hypothetical protein